MIKYSNLNFPENGDPIWLSINLQRVDQWSMIFQLQDLRHRAVEYPDCDWLFLGDRFLSLDHVESQHLLCDAIRAARHVVINDLVHNWEGQLAWVADGLPAWMPERDYELVTNSQTELGAPPWLRIHYYDFLFNRTKAYYSGFPFDKDPWYHAGRENYRAPLASTETSKRDKVFISPCRLYVEQDRTQFRKRLFDLMEGYAEDGYRSGPGRVRNSEWDKSPTGLYLASTADDPLINFEQLGWSFDPIRGETRISLKRLSAWNGSRWSGYNPIHNRYYEDTFVSIYGETIEHGNVVVITEKSYEPLIKGHFILPFGACGLIGAIEKQGFKLPTFIDYSYDQTRDDASRFELYSSEVKRLLRIPHQRWRDLWRENLETVRHNQRLFHTRGYDHLEMDWDGSS